MIWKHNRELPNFLLQTGPVKTPSLLQNTINIIYFAKLLRYLTAPADYLDARATKFQILKTSYQLG